MSKIRSFTVLVCMLWVANAWGAPFKDDFNRANGAVGNGWTILTNGTVTSTIVNNEVLVTGTEATDWARCGIQRAVVGETKVSCDAKWDDAFNFHIQIAAQGSSAYVEVYTWPGGALQYANSPAGGWPGWVAFTGANAQTVAGQYNNIMLEVKGSAITVTLNGKVVETLTNAGFTTTIRQVQIASDAAAATKGSIHIDNVQIGTVVAGKAKDPSPADSATDVPADVSVGWTAGAYAATHNVYFGTSFADANTADVTKAVSKGQTGTTFKPTSLLEYGKTYYWRVDEVNAPPTSTVFKGNVWSFTVEPYTYPIANVTATASSYEKTTTMPANTVNGSGLTGDLHGTVATTMWNSAMTDTAVWIQYQFDNVYKLYELWVWNHNTDIEAIMGYGFKDVTIEYSVDGTAWTLLSNTQFAQAPGTANYAHNTTVNLNGVMAKYVRLTPKSNWTVVGWKQYGLSEVRFYYVPVQARAPQPAMNATGVSLTATLDWRPGRDLTSQKVYLDTDKTAVTNGTAPVQTVTDHGFTPGALSFGTTYYWKVDEIGTATYPGSVWSFTTQEFAVVDDFESYTDKEGGRIYETWIDGYGTTTNGSQVGYGQAPFAETTIIRGGRQSMPFSYNNTATVAVSEATRTFASAQNWTAGGANTLTLYVRGNPAKFVEAAPGQYKVSSNSGDVWGTSDNFRFVYKQLTGDGSISAKVIAVTNTTSNWAKAGVMIRNTLDQNSAYAFMFPTPDGRRAFQNRPTTAGSAVSAHSNTNTITFPFWVKVERKGTQLTAYYSTDGKTWTLQPATENTGTDRSPNPQTITMGSSICIGMAVASNNAAAAPCVGEFSDVVTAGSVGSQWIVADVGPNTSNDPAPLYVTVEDSAKKKKTVVNPDATAVNKAAWTQWKIPLSSLTGVNLAAVTKLTIGVGDSASPKAAAGTLYIDDIGFGQPAVLVNLATNGGFETGASAPWGTYGSAASAVAAAVVTACTGANVAEPPIEGKYCLNLKVSGPGTNFWDAGFSMSPLPAFVQGTKYTMSAFFKVKSGTGKVNMKPEHAGGNWEGYGEKQVTITEKWVEYYVTTPVFTSNVSPTSLTFHIGFQAQELWVDNIKFYVGDYVPSN